MDVIKNKMGPIHPDEQRYIDAEMAKLNQEQRDKYEHRAGDIKDLPVI